MVIRVTVKIELLIRCYLSSFPVATLPNGAGKT